MKMKKLFRRWRKPPPPDPEEGPSEPAYLAGHILTDAIHAEAPPIASPNLDELERTADGQRQSAFLRLPMDVRRQIYDNVFNDANLTQHVYVKDGRYTHTPCITDHNAPDERQVEIENLFPIDATCLKDPVWSRRLLSSWVNHWRCEEAAVATAAKGALTPTPVWSLLVCCKRT